MQRRLYLLSAVLALTTSTISSGQTAKPMNPSSETRPFAPAFSVTSLEGQKLELAALSGKVVVMNFWFTGCLPCIEEMPKLNALVDKYKNKGVVFIAPTWDNASTLRAFLKDHRFKYQVVPNAGGLILGPFSDGSGSVVFPTHLVIDQEGKIDTRVTGTKQLRDLRNAIARLVNTPLGKAKQIHAER
jgi:peroxiredoxin